MQRRDTMKVLELFAGTRSVSRAFEQRGHETYSVDWDEQFDVTLHADISKLTTKDIVDLCGGVPDVVWVSPECVTYSVMAISKHRERETVRLHLNRSMRNSAI